MTTARSSEYELLLKTLTHEWIDFEEYVYKFGAAIPPGVALRKYQDLYEAGVKRSKSNKPKPPLTQERAIESGRRTLLRIALSSGLGAGLLAERESGDGVRQIRRNTFDAAYIDALLANQTASSKPEPAKKEEKVEIPVVHTPVVSQLPQLMFDHKNVKRDIQVQHSKDASSVVVIINDVLDNMHLTMLFSAPASDWFSDQMGLQAMFIRNGRENPEKIFRT